MAETASLHGVLNVLKPPGMTSHDVVMLVRRALGTRRVGHTGTLDPAAAGVLPVCVGQATRLMEYLQSGAKEYIAEATFGYETDSCDAVGKTVSEGDASAVNPESLRGVLEGFRGTISQTPPLHSAIKVDGKKLYELARAGETAVEIPTREVLISQLLVTRFVADAVRPRAMLKIECGGGTYIRSLVRDIGRALGCGATMTFLVRTRSGMFSIDEASTLQTAFGKAMIPITTVLGWCAEATVEDDAAAHDLGQGRYVPLDMNAPRVLVWNRARSVAALAVPLDAGDNQKGLHEPSPNPSQREGRADSSPSGGGWVGANCKSPKKYKPDKVFFLNS
jgi:tRNA pseudouridine55 synthase